MPYIYKITNLINQKSYIGKTSKVRPIERWYEHIRESKKERSAHRALYRAINKYGLSSFSFEVLEETDNPNEREKFYIEHFDTYSNGYNETHGGDGRKYVAIDEIKVCKSYAKYRSVATVASKFNCDRNTIERILSAHKVNVIGSNLLAKQNLSKKVARYDLKTGEILEVFDCIGDANKKYNAGKHISSVCKGKRTSCRGFGWKYV